MSDMTRDEKKAKLTTVTIEIERNKGEISKLERNTIIAGVVGTLGAAITLLNIMIGETGLYSTLLYLLGISLVLAGGMSTFWLWSNMEKLRNNIEKLTIEKDKLSESIIDNKETHE